LILENGSVRFGQERRPGIPAKLSMTADLAELLGLYCAEGCVTKGAGRPNSYTLTFAFGLHEKHLADRVRDLLQQTFALKAYETLRTTTRAVSIGKASLALMFASLCGSGSEKKKIPTAILTAEPPIAEAFLSAYVS